MKYILALIYLGQIICWARHLKWIALNAKQNETNFSLAAVRFVDFKFNFFYHLTILDTLNLVETKFYLLWLQQFLGLGGQIYFSFWQMTMALAWVSMLIVLWSFFGLLLSLLHKAMKIKVNLNQHLHPCMLLLEEMRIKKIILFVYVPVCVYLGFKTDGPIDINPNKCVSNWYFSLGSFFYHCSIFVFEQQFSLLFSVDNRK